jgi:hypothetical protein
MSAVRINDPVLVRFRQAVGEAYGSKLERVTLFGSRAKRREDLSDARQIAEIKHAKVAARSACYAAFHAAEALIFERTGKAVKTHRGVRIEFARLTKDDHARPKLWPDFWRNPIHTKSSATTVPIPVRR